jgi:hypothetical protein
MIDDVDDAKDDDGYKYDNEDCDKKEKKEIPYKRAFKGHRVHNGYTVLSLNPKMRGWVTSVSSTGN